MIFSEFVNQSAGAAWLFIPTAILLGALHGLEPGHSKTMMAAFIVAIRGTLAQAVLLAVSATISHTAIVWLIAVLALTYGSQWGAETTEPYFQLASGAIIIAVALWMIARTWRDQRAAQSHDHDHSHSHGHSHGGHSHGAHRHAELDSAAAGYQDAHERAHAQALQHRFAGRTVTTGQIVLFGLTGGLLPCPGAITVLLLCLQLQRFGLGMVLVLCFSIGLALTLVASGAVAALGMHHASRRWSGFDAFARRLPYASSAIVIAMGLYVGFEGWRHLA